jgi:hypothetical protein
MTIKEQLIQEIEQAPENLAVQLLNFLHTLQSQPEDIFFVTNIEENPFKSIDGFMVIQGQSLSSNLDWVSLTRQERINDLM